MKKNKDFIVPRCNIRTYECMSPEKVDCKEYGSNYICDKGNCVEEITLDCMIDIDCGPHVCTYLRKGILVPKCNLNTHRCETDEVLCGPEFFC